MAEVITDRVIISVLYPGRLQAGYENGCLKPMHQAQSDRCSHWEKGPRISPRQGGSPNVKFFSFLFLLEHANGFRIVENHQHLIIVTRIDYDVIKMTGVASVQA